MRWKAPLAQNSWGHRFYERFTASNDGYAWSGAVNLSRSYTNNGLNQHTAAGAVSLGYDSRGNLNSSGSDSYTYSSENLLTAGPGSAALSYDPLLRLYQATQSGTVRFAYDGSSMIAEYNASNVLQRRHVFGPGADEILTSYDSGGNRSWPVADERGTIVAKSDASGNAATIASYDEYGIPAGGDVGRFGYTGQAWLPELGMSYYKARIYSPTLGRFMQTDPIGHKGGLNLYAYVKDDPVNYIDPTGLREVTNGDGSLTCDVDFIDGVLIYNWCRYDPGIVVNGVRSDPNTTLICSRGSCSGLVEPRVHENGTIELIVSVPGAPQQSAATEPTNNKDDDQDSYGPADMCRDVGDFGLGLGTFSTITGTYAAFAAPTGVGGVVLVGLSTSTGVVSGAIGIWSHYYC